MENILKEQIETLKRTLLDTQVERDALRARVAELEEKDRDHLVTLSQVQDREKDKAEDLRHVLRCVMPVLDEALTHLSIAKHDLYKASVTSYLGQIVRTQEEGEESLSQIRCALGISPKP